MFYSGSYVGLCVAMITKSAPFVRLGSKIVGVSKEVKKPRNVVATEIRVWLGDILIFTFGLGDSSFFLQQW
jgi:hypothetical protein